MAGVYKITQSSKAVTMKMGLACHLLAFITLLTAGQISCFAADKLATSADTRSLSQRISAPDLSREVKVQEFRVGAMRTPPTSHSQRKPFHWVQKKIRKDASKPSFYAGKKHGAYARSAGSKSFGTRDAYFGSAASKEKQKTLFQTRTLPTSEVHDANAYVPTREDKLTANKPFTGRGTAQGALDQLGTGAEPLTVEQVREILNRNQ